MKLAVVFLSILGAALCFLVSSDAARRAPTEADAIALILVGALAAYGVGSITSWMILYLGHRGRRW